MEVAAKMECVIITGMSGAGKTKAVDWFEDHGYYCIDNMPPLYIKNFVEVSAYGGNAINKAAFVVDIRSNKFFPDLEDVFNYLDKTAAVSYKVLFIAASVDTLLRRYSETRRNHPLAKGATTREVIEEEKNLLEGLRERADFVIDTTNLKIADFNKQLNEIFIKKQDSKQRFVINIKSFGYKHGIPVEADLVFDMRCIPNPYYVKSLRKLTGNNKKVSHYVLKQPIAQEYISKIIDMVVSLAPGYIREGKYHLNIGIGCTGGQHRSVAVANELAVRFKNVDFVVNLEHREQ